MTVDMVLNLLLALCGAILILMDGFVIAKIKGEWTGYDIINVSLLSSVGLAVIAAGVIL